jgi:uncharacterized protein
LATAQIPIDQAQVADFCRRWQITQFALFGSVLRSDFKPESDVDVLVSFREDAPWSLLHLAQMQEELRLLFGRDVDLVEESGVRNPFRRQEIRRTRQLLYAA